MVHCADSTAFCCCMFSSFSLSSYSRWSTRSSDPVVSMQKLKTCTFLKGKKIVPMAVQFFFTNAPSPLLEFKDLRTSHASFVSQFSVRRRCFIYTKTLRIVVRLPHHAPFSNFFSQPYFRVSVFAPGPFFPPHFPFVCFP